MGKGKGARSVVSGQVYEYELVKVLAQRNIMAFPAPMSRGHDLYAFPLRVDEEHFCLPIEVKSSKKDVVYWTRSDRLKRQIQYYYDLWEKEKLSTLIFFRWKDMTKKKINSKWRFFHVRNFPTPYHPMKFKEGRKLNTFFEIISDCETSDEILKELIA